MNKAVEYKSNRLHLIDQRALPTKFEILSYDTVSQVARAIREMVVRGAPAIGAAGAFGMALAILRPEKRFENLVLEIEEAKKTLDRARPTAVNLEWATSRVRDVALKYLNDSSSDSSRREKLYDVLLREAHKISQQDIEINTRMGRIGSVVVPKNANVLHHCNTGSLATVDRGTALGVIYESHDQNKKIHVWVDETRPRLQGARLTAWELMRYGVPMHLIADNASGSLMRRGLVDIVLVGADRVAANGDVVNKIGTYKLAVLAKENGVPFYPVVPTSTIDLSCKSGDDIEIEERDEREVSEIRGVRIAPEKCQVYNPAFDMTPSKYVTGIITEEGICYPPFNISLRRAVMQSRSKM